MKLRARSGLAFLLSVNALADTFFLDGMSVESVDISGWLSPGDSLVPSSSAPSSASPLWWTRSVPKCTAEARCFVRLSIAGELAVYAQGPHGDEVVSVIAAASGSMRSTDYVYWLEISEDGDVVLSALSAEEDEENVIWHSGSAFPADCDAACRKGAVLVARLDGSLALQQGDSAAMQAYLEVGAPAAARLRSCLWDNGFTADARAGSGDVAPPAGERIGDCCVPPALILATFSNSGTLLSKATSAVTCHAVFTDEGDTDASARDMLEMQKMHSMCGMDTCADLGLCTMHCDHGGGSELPPAGKGALVKSHAGGCKNQGGCAGADCVSRFQEALTAEGRRDPYGVLRVYRNPFDHLVARFHDMDEVEHLGDLSGSRESFLKNDAAFVKDDLASYLAWHLHANLALEKMAKPTVLLPYEDMYTDPVGYLRSVVAKLGWSEEEVPNAILEKEMEALKGRSLPTTATGETVPVCIESFYDAETIHYVANTINDMLDRTDCLRVIPSHRMLV